MRTLLGIEREDIITLVEDKVAEVAEELKRRYRDVDELILDLF